LDLYYFLAKVHYSVVDLAIKKKHLQYSIKYYNIFIQKCLLLRIVIEKDLIELGLMPEETDLYETDSSDTATSSTIFNHVVSQTSSGGTMKQTNNLEKKRMNKIAKYKKEKEIKQKIAVRKE